MKKSKILVPAVALLALSTAAATTGTVAWFTTNTHVEANSLAMKIQTAKDLRISDGHGPYEWKTALVWEDSIDAAAPCTAIDGTVDGTVNELIGSVTNHTMVGDVNFVVPKLGAGANSINANGTATHALAKGTGNGTYWQAAASGTNYIAKPYALLYAGTAPTATVNMTLTVLAGSKMAIDEAFRVGYLVDGNFTAFELLTYSSTAYTVTVPQLSLTNNVAKNLDIYVWYDGEDGACVNANAIVNQLTVKIAYDIAG